MKKFVINLYKDPFFKNSIYLMATNCTSLVLGFLFWIVVARYYTPKDIGIVSAILSSMALISMISAVGLPVAILYFLPRSKDSNKIIDSCLMVGTTMSIIFSMIFILGLNIWEPLLKIIFNFQFDIIFIIVTTMTTLSGLISGAFTAGRRSSFHLVKENIFGAVKILPLILFTGLGSIGIFLSWGFGLMMAMIIGFILLNKAWQYSPKISFDPTIKKMAIYSAGNYFAAMFGGLPRLILPIMIVNIISTEAAGYFFIATAIANILYGVYQSIGDVLLSQSSGEDFSSNLRKAIRFNFSILCIGILFLILFGKVVLNIFNHIYAANVNTLIILSIASLPLSTIGIFNYVRYTQKRVGSAIKINIFVAITTLVLSVPLMKALNIEGAALAYLIASTIAAVAIIIRIENPKEFTLKLLTIKKSSIS